MAVDIIGGEVGIAMRLWDNAIIAKSELRVMGRVNLIQKMDYAKGTGTRSSEYVLTRNWT